MWEIIFYKLPSGKLPVLEYLKNLDPKTKAKATRALDLLEQYGPAIGMPHVRMLDSAVSLYELRIPFGGQAHRILFSKDQNKLVLVHGFLKKSEKTPKKELEIGVNRTKDYLQRKGQKE